MKRTKLLMILAGERKSDLAEEGRSDVYLDVLDDVPCWAVEAAVARSIQFRQAALQAASEA